MCSKGDAGGGDGCCRTWRSYRAAGRRTCSRHGVQACCRGRNARVNGQSSGSAGRLPCGRQRCGDPRGGTLIPAVPALRIACQRSAGWASGLSGCWACLTLVKHLRGRLCRRCGANVAWLVLCCTHVMQDASAFSERIAGLAQSALQSNPSRGHAYCFGARKQGRAWLMFHAAAKQQKQPETGLATMLLCMRQAGRMKASATAGAGLEPPQSGDGIYKPAAVAVLRRARRSMGAVEIIKCAAPQQLAAGSYMTCRCSTAPQPDAAKQRQAARCQVQVQAPAAMQLSATSSGPCRPSSWKCP